MPSEPGPGRGTPDRWPLWIGPVGFGIAVLVTVLLAALVGAIAVAAGAEDPGDEPAVALIATCIQDAALIGTALLLGSRYGPVGLADFGLRRVALRTAAKALGVALVAFYVISGMYAAILRPDAEQDIVETLGAEKGLGYLLGTAALVILIAPVAEELFFRGFFYRSLRNRMPPIGAALVVGLVFGSIHYTDSETLQLIPVLVLLGVLFCLLYERTGSLYPAIALHAINNTLALATSADADGAVVISLATGTIALAACAAATRGAPRA